MGTKSVHCLGARCSGLGGTRAWSPSGLRVIPGGYVDSMSGETSAPQDSAWSNQETVKPQSQCWRLDARTLTLLAQDPVWVSFVSKLRAGQPSDPREAAYELLGRRLRHVDVTWATKAEATSALCVNMGGGIPFPIIEVIVEAAGHAQSS